MRLIITKIGSGDVSCPNNCYEEWGQGQCDTTTGQCVCNDAFFIGMSLYITFYHNTARHDYSTLLYYTNYNTILFYTVLARLHSALYTPLCTILYYLSLINNYYVIIRWRLRDRIWQGLRLGEHRYTPHYTTPTTPTTITNYY